MSATKYIMESFGPRVDAFLRPLLTRGGFELKYEMAPGASAHPDFESPEITVRFNGPDVDVLLANKAELLLALEQVTMEALNVPSEDHSRISFDANDYRMLRIEELRLSASAAAEKVKRTGTPFFFNPMNSRERRVIHLSLRNETTLRSESTGFGGQRQVVVYPASMPSVPTPPPRPSPPPRSAGPGRGDRDRHGPGGRPPGRYQDRGPRRG
ncbi:MAG: R3H domain-containing nucleic acid-binding protein [Bryobacteraceae bacterium]